MLRDRRERFCEEYLLDLNGTGAAIRAGFSRKTAYSQAHRLLKNVEVSERIEELQSDRSDRLQITADMVVQELWALYQADLRQLFSPEGALLPPSEFPDDVARVVAAMSRRQTSRGDYYSLRFVDRLRLIELLGRHTGAFR